MALDEKGRPVYRGTTNVNAAISTGADLIRNTAPYNLDGTGTNIGIWDAGSVLTTHQEFGGRVTVGDGASSNEHSTHVGGTIGASGVDSNALGMAPNVTIYSYDWTSDTSEMTGRAASGASQAGKIHISNHSYGVIAGWEYGDYSGTEGYHWMGANYPSVREDEDFGRYGSDAAAWDNLVFNSQYFLPFKSAGNDRNDTGPSSGTTFYYYSGGWASATYDASTAPYDDGYDNGGFDTILTDGNAKNIMTVGAVNDAVSGGVRNPLNGTMSSFSGWGPTDDGRIKPDIVANGVGLYSSSDLSNSSYTTKSGTSMSSPNAAGSAQLLVEYYGEQFPGQAMRASTLKALIIHTADDLGNPGPDYSYGWGLMNVKAAADIIKGSPGAARITEDWLSTTNSSDSYDFEWDGVSPIRATLCWTDLTGFWLDGLDNTTPVLVSDLDIRILGPGGSPTYRPYILNPSSPASPATTGDNTRDNVEQVYIASPPTAGVYTVQVTHKGSLIAAQRYSLIMTGQVVNDYFTELFDAGDNDLAYTSVTFFPNGTGGYTNPCKDSASSFPTDPAGGTPLILQDDHVTSFQLGGGTTVPFFGTSYAGIAICSNGYINVGGAKLGRIESLAAHFSSPPQISGLFDDLDPSAGGTISWKKAADRVAVTYENVPEYSLGGSNSFQIEMFFDGRISITLLGLTATDGLVGLSDGNGIPVDFSESDLSDYDSCLLSVDRWDLY